MTLRLRDDDAALLTWLRDTTGVGLTRSVAARANSKPQVEWRVQTQDGCRALAQLLCRFEIRGRRRREVELWREAVDWWSSGLSNRVIPLRGLRDRLADARRYRPPAREAIPRPESDEVLRAYLHGLLCAEASFAVRAFQAASMTVHMRRDERPLLEMLAGALGIGYVRRPAAPYGTTAAVRLLARRAPR